MEGFLYEMRKGIFFLVFFFSRFLAHGLCMRTLGGFLTLVYFHIKTRQRWWRMMKGVIDHDLCSLPHNTSGLEGDFFICAFRFP